MRTWPALEIAFSAPELSDLVLATLSDANLVAVDEGPLDVAPPVWRVFFHDTSERDAARVALLAGFPHGALTLRAIDIPDEDWAARSQAALTAVTVGNIAVAPPWDPMVAGREPGVIVIQPSMGFGTGHHATTRLCLDALQHLDLTGKTVLDVGTGSGVLAIAAHRLGAGQVLAVDDDPDAIEAARENLQLNPGVNVTLGAIDIRQATLRRFHVVVGNLTGGLIMTVADRLTGLTAENLVLSGLMDSEEHEVLTRFPGWTIARRSQEDEWVCLILRPAGRSTT